MSGIACPPGGRNFYTQEEDLYLRHNYTSLGPVACAAHLRRPAASVRARANKLGIVKRYGSRKERAEAKAARCTEGDDLRAALTGDDLRANPLAPQVTVCLPAAQRWWGIREFDPALRRAAVERANGLPPGALILRTSPL